MTNNDDFMTSSPICRDLWKPCACLSSISGLHIAFAAAVDQTAVKKNPAIRCSASTSQQHAMSLISIKLSPNKLLWQTLGART